MNLIGLLGEQNSGKSYLAQWLYRTRGYLPLAFADRMKTYAQAAFGIDPELLWGPSELRGAPLQHSEEAWLAAWKRFPEVARGLLVDVIGFAKDKPNRWGAAYVGLSDHWCFCKKLANDDYVSPRIILQTLGTEWGRALSPDLWWKLLYQKAIPSLLSRSPSPYLSQVPSVQILSQEKGISSVMGFVVPDHRFRNEVEATRSLGGKVYRLLSFGEPTTTGVVNHASEIEASQVPEELAPVLRIPRFTSDEEADAFLSPLFPV
jgi:hypothetical protein